MKSLISEYASKKRSIYIRGSRGVGRVVQWFIRLQKVTGQERTLMSVVMSIFTELFSLYYVLDICVSPSAPPFKYHHGA